MLSSLVIPCHCIPFDMTFWLIHHLYTICTASIPVIILEIT